MEGIEKFVNNNFKVLSYMYDNRVKHNLVRITQTELSEDLGLNRGTVNGIFRLLREDGYILADEIHNSKYYITDKGIKLVQYFYRAVC